MKNSKKLLFGFALCAMVFTACKDDDEGDTPAATPVTTTPSTTTGDGYTLIATDATGDVNGAPADATKIEYKQDSASGTVAFRITAVDVSKFAKSPSADFGFNLPNGTTDNVTPGIAAGGGNPTTKVHRTGNVYTDTDGSAPSTYTYMQNFATNSISRNNSQTGDLCSGNACIDINTVTAKNWIIYTFDREDIISDAEMGGNSATIKLVANLGSNIGWNDLITDGGTFTVTK